MKRKEIIEKIQKLKIEENVLREQLELLDLDEKTSKSKKLLGKCYQNNMLRSDYISCLFIYGYDIKTCEPLSLEISYYPETDTFFNIEYHCVEYYTLVEDYIEITREEFMKHYNNVQEIIKKHINEKN